MREKHLLLHILRYLISARGVQPPGRISGRDTSRNTHKNHETQTNARALENCLLRGNSKRVHLPVAGDFCARDSRFSSDSAINKN